MSDIQHLVSKLKALKLGGMLDTLELRLKQSQQEHLGYIEFLEFLLEDEVQRRANKKLATRVAQAHFEEIKTFETFNFEFKINIALSGAANRVYDLRSIRTLAHEKVTNK